MGGVNSCAQGSLGTCRRVEKQAVLSVPFSVRFFFFFLNARLPQSLLSLKWFKLHVLLKLGFSVRAFGE